MSDAEVAESHSSFPFFLPVSGGVTIRKSKPESDDPKDRFIVFIEASNEFRDQENEIVLQKAMAAAKDDFLTKGVISWDHMQKSEGALPRHVIGEPLEVSFPQDTRSTLVKAQLYHKNTIAQDLVDNLESGSTRFGASIGGKKLAKSFAGVVQRVFWDEVAVTYKPVNSTTLGNVSQTPLDSLAKALTAGNGVNPAEFTSGRAMTLESLMGADRRIKLPEEQKDRLVENIGWSLEGALMEFAHETYKKGFIAAFKYMQNTPEWTDESLRTHLETKVSKKTAGVIMEYLNQNMNKALHVLIR